MTFLRPLRPLLVVAAVTLVLWERRVVAFTHPTIRPLQFSSIGIDTSQTPSNCPNKSRRIFAVPPPGGLSFEEEQASVATVTTGSQKETETSSSSAGQLNAGSITSENNVIATTNNNVNDSSPSPPRQIRGKLNEIDFCMSPSDVSLSRLYQTSPISQSVTSSQSLGNTIGGDGAGKIQNDLGAPRIMSLTRALNSASNRAVRRILLSRSWPSPEALNMSLRQVLSSSSSFGNSAIQENRQVDLSKASREEEEKGEENTAKCPVPRPILNIIMKEQGWKVDKRGETGSEVMENDDLNVKGEEVPPSTPLGRKGRTDERWVEEQLKAFRDTYGSVEGYPYAEAYMECILSLATSGVESERVSEVLQQGIYEDAYKRVISVLGSAGVTFEQVEGVNTRMKIASKLRDDDICLSMLDKINIKNGGKSYISISEQNPSMAVDKQDEAEKQEEEGIDENSVETIEVSDKNDQDTNSIVVEDRIRAEKPKGEKKMGNLFEMILSRLIKKNDDGNQEKEEVPSSNIEEEGEAERKVDVSDETEKIKPEDLGGVLLSKEEPTITRQLNVLSNIVKRTLLFGGDQEILVLSKTLEADRPAFIQRWYPETVKSMPYDDVASESRQGVQFFNCIVQLLKDCYNNGVVTTLGPPLPLSPSYTNSYERLTAMLAELGSGYVRPISDSKVLSKKPQSAREELIRFSQWEVALRKTKPDVSNFPSDLVGSWQVKDQIGGKVIGISTIVFKPEGKIEVAPPLKGLKWRLDPGPTHLDTCTFQVLSEDGTILQYRGFMDRGARLESRFSKRSIKIRGTVSFQMRDSNKALIGEDFKRDLLPIESQPGTTRFVMSKVFDLNG